MSRVRQLEEQGFSGPYPANTLPTEVFLPWARHNDLESLAPPPAERETLKIGIEEDYISYDELKMLAQLTRQIKIMSVKMEPAIWALDRILQQQQ